ncbi:DinB family protein [Streptomyces tanashiensis]
MNSAGLLVDSFGRIREVVHEAVEGLTDEELAVRIDPDANSVAWLGLAPHPHPGRPPRGRVRRGAAVDLGRLAGPLGLPFPPAATGYGQSRAQSGKVRAPAELLLGYHDAVHARTEELVRAVTNADLDRVVDTAWDPPVTLGVRLVSVIADDLQHAGQAAYVRGVVERRG